MIAYLKPYPVMKDSGLSWVKEVPKHWSYSVSGCFAAMEDLEMQEELPAEAD